MNPHTTENDPFAILGIDSSASEQVVRQRYLALVKLHPPESDPARFRDIHQAYESAQDPLILAQRLLTPTAGTPDWDEVINQQKKQPPNLTAGLLIALGNRPPMTVDSNTAASNTHRVDEPHE